jgi:hypothetical protein
MLGIKLRSGVLGFVMTLRIGLRHQGPEHMPRMHCNLKACCATLLPPCFGRSHCRRQMSPRLTRREISKQRKVERMGEDSIRLFCLIAEFQVTFRDLLHAVNLRHGTLPFRRKAVRIFSP